MTLRSLLFLPVFTLSLQAVPAEPKPVVFPPTPPPQPRSVAESLKTMHLPPGYRLEPVLAEPQIAEPVALAVDGKAETRYNTRKEQKPGMWLQIELPQPTRIAGLELESNKSPGDYPRGYTVELSTDGQTWNKPVAAGKGTVPDTVIQFPPAEAKFIRITQTGEQKGKYWSIHELQLLAAR